MGFLSDAGLGAANIFESPLTALFDPGDLAGTRSGKLAKEAARKAAEEQESAIGLGIEEQRRQFDITTEQLTAAEKANREALLRGQRQFGAQVSPFAVAGREALQQQQALLGFGTPEEQEAARATLTESPGQKFLRERQEKSLLRSSAALGGLGGGNVRTALQQQAAGFAAQIESDQFSRLQQLTGQGQIAAQNIGQAALGTASGIGSGAISSAARQGQFGQATAANVSNLLQAGGQARASGILGQQQAAAQQQQQQQQLAATAFQFFSDPKLKENIEKVDCINGFNWYKWTWNKLAERFGLSGVSEGVMADEIRHLRPDLISIEDGFMKVDYIGLGVL